jgi:hypothetical protein
MKALVVMVILTISMSTRPCNAQGVWAPQRPPQRIDEPSVIEDVRQQYKADAQQRREAWAMDEQQRTLKQIERNQETQIILDLLYPRR